MGGNYFIWRGECADEEGTAVPDETNDITEYALFPWEGADWYEENDVADIANEEKAAISADEWVAVADEDTVLFFLSRVT